MLKLVTPSDIDEIDLASLRFWTRPLEETEGALQLLRRQRPVSFHEELGDGVFPPGPGFWAVTRHAHVLEVSRNAGVFSSSPTASIRPFPPQVEPYFRSMVNMDDPRHTRLRRIVSRGFTPAALAKLEPAVVKRARQVIGNVVDKGECDFATEIAAPYPVLVICDMMGIPESEVPFVLEQVNVVMAGETPPGTPPGTDPVEIEASALEALTLLMRGIGRDRLAKPRDDLTSQLVSADIDDDALSEEELASFFVLLILAGSDTTRHAASHGMKALSDHPDERRRWAAGFERLAPTAVDEILRWASPVRSFRRTATRDVELGGQPIREGEKVVMWYGSANRDESVFESPYRFDVTRRPNDHLAFGGTGAHYCLGASLARRELTILFRELFERLPDLRTDGRPKRVYSLFVNGLRRMPCSFTAGGA